MFKSQILSEFVTKFQDPLSKLKEIEKKLNARFFDLKRPIRALILSVASGEPLLLIGPPGTGKSRLIRAFCGLIGLLNENDLSQAHPGYFEYLLTPFTEPSELFGFFDIKELMKKDGSLRRIEDGMMRQAKVIYLDDVFNGSSAILNSILTFLNERILHDRGERKKVAMQCLFAATNHIPESPELRAIFDRFVLRCAVDNIEAELVQVKQLLHKGWLETYKEHKPLDNPAQSSDKRCESGTEHSSLLDDMERLRGKIVERTTEESLVPQHDGTFCRCLVQQVQTARQYGLSEMSNRRLVKMMHIMLIHRIYEAVCKGEVEKKGSNSNISLGPEELKLLTRYFIDHADDEIVTKMERAVDCCWR